MSRDLSAEFTESLLAQASGFLVLELMTISHADLDTPLRAVNNSEDAISSRGNIFSPVPFSFTWPEDKDGVQSKSKLVVDNTSQWLTEDLRALRGEFTALMEQVSVTNAGADPEEWDTVEHTFLPMRMAGLTYDVRSMKASLIIDVGMGKAFPFGIFDPKRFKAMF